MGETPSKLLRLVMLAALGGCEPPLQMNLIIYDACDQPGTLESAEHIELAIASDSQGPASSTVWDAATGEGELGEVPLIDDAVVTVMARASDGGGGPGDAIAATTVAFVDLSGADGNPLVELNVVVGRVNQFMNTTGTADDIVCSRLQAERGGHRTTELDDGRVLITGGVRPDVSTGLLQWWEDTELYDPKTGTFLLGPKMTWPRRGHTITKLQDGNVFIAGGEGPIDAGGEPQPLLVAEIFEPGADELDADNAVNISEQRANHTATLLDDGRVLLAGGTSLGGVALASTRLYDPINGNTVEGPSLVRARAFHAAVRVGEAQVVLIGGQDAAGALASVEVLDLRSAPGTAVEIEALAVARGHLVAALVPGNSGLIAVAGGFTDAVTKPENGRGIRSIELLQLDTSQVENSSFVCRSQTLEMEHARGAAGIAEIDEGLLIFGGLGENGDPRRTAEILSVPGLSACDVRSELTDSMTSPRVSPQVSPLVGGDLLITGGFGFSQGEVVPVAQGEIYVRSR